MSRPQPHGCWRWGGPDWPRRSSPHRIAGVTVSVPEPEAVRARWSTVLGGADLAELGIRFTDDHGSGGIVEVALAGPEDATVDVGLVRLVCTEMR